MPRLMARKSTGLGTDLIESIKLVAGYQRGEIELEQGWPKPLDVKPSASA
jgi:hypothetical protein